MKFLIKSGQDILVWDGTSLKKVGSYPQDITEQLFLANGVDTIATIPISTLNQLGEYSILTYSDTGAEPNVYTKYLNGIIKTTDLTRIDLQNYTGINKVNVSGNGSNAKIAVSFDYGNTWYSILHDFAFKERISPTLSADSPLVSCSSHYEDRKPWRLFDGAVGGYWTTAWENGIKQLPQWASVDLGKKYRIMSYKLSATTDGYYFMLKSWIIKGSNDNQTWEDIHVVNDAQDWSRGETREYTLSEPACYRYYMLYVTETYSQTGYFAVGEWEIYGNENVNVEFKPIQLEDIKNSTLSNINISTITSQQWSTIFKPTALDIALYLENDDYVDSIIVELPANKGPQFTSLQLNTDKTHKDNVVLTGRLVDLENDKASYRIQLNGKTIVGWTPERSTPFDINHTILFDDLIADSTNIITIEAKDSEGLYSTTQTLSVVRYNTAPSLTILEANSKFLRFTIGDSDSDQLSYQVLLNDMVVAPWTNFAAPPIEVTMHTPHNLVQINKQNTYKIIAKDSFGKVTEKTVLFVGDYAGLMFVDPVANDYYSDDRGKTLKQLDFGIIVAGQENIPTRVQLKNTTGYTLKNINLYQTSKFVDTEMELEFCRDEMFNSAGDTLLIDDVLLCDGETLDFWVRPKSTRNAAQDNIFKIKVRAEIAL